MNHLTSHMTDDAYLDVIATLEAMKEDLNPEEAYKISDLDNSIACVKEHAEYAQIGPVELCRDAVARITPTLPVMKYGCTYRCPPDCGGHEYDEYGDIPHCPQCDAELQGNEDVCRYCGQALIRK